MEASETFLKDMLYNLTSNSGATDEYCAGLMVGVVGTVMALRKINHKRAMAYLKQFMPTEPYRQLPPFFFIYDFYTSNP